MTTGDAFHVYDTTLRDGAQQEGLNLSVADKLSIAYFAQHQLDEVLPRPAVLLVCGQDRSDVVGGTHRDGVPAAGATGGVREGVLGDHLADRIALPALRRALRVRR